MTSKRMGPARRARGTVLIYVFLGLLLLSLMVPLFNTLLRSQSKVIAYDASDATAMGLAEMGLAQVEAQAVASTTFWDDLLAGVALEGYSGDREYTAPGGRYKIYASSTVVPKQIKLVAVGRHDATRRMRAVESLLVQDIHSQALAVISLGDTYFHPNAEVHWGSIYAYNDIKRLAVMAATFPRKFAAGDIEGRAMDPPFYSDNKEYYARRDDIGLAPSIDFVYYEGKAKQSQIPTSVTQPSKGALVGALGAPSIANPLGSGHFVHLENGTNYGLIFQKDHVNGRYEFRSSTSVIYYNGNTTSALTPKIQLADAFLEVEALVAHKTGTVGSGGAEVRSLPGNGITLPVPIPKDAADEYVEPAAKAYWDNNFKSVYEDNPGRCCISVPNVKVKGLVISDYYTPLDTDEDLTIVGAAVIYRTASTLRPLRWHLYFNEDVSSTVQYLAAPTLAGSSIQRVSWREITPYW